jgi:hypothetical protein
MAAILISILAGVLKGQALGALLGGLTASQWLTLAEGLAGLVKGGAADPGAAQLLGGLDPSLGAVLDGIAKGLDPKVAAANGQAAMALQQQRDTDA